MMSSLMLMLIPILLGALELCVPHLERIQFEGPNTRFPLLARSIRQQCVANSTPDAELAAIALAFRVMAIPALDLWDELLPVPVKVFVHEDNAACISVICSGKNPTMWYIGRTQ